MTTPIRGGAPTSFNPRLTDTGGRIPFELVDVNGSGKISPAELQVALGRLFPSLNESQINALSDTAFASVQKQGLPMNREGWTIAEQVVLQAAKAADPESAISQTTSGWTTETGIRIAPASVGQDRIPLPPVSNPGMYARNDYAMTGYPPYQYPVGMPSLFPGMNGPYEHHGAGYNTAMGAGRGVLGFLKMLPVVGHVINGVDFMMDIPQALRAWTNPSVPFQQKLKAGSDLLAHGAGMFVPQIGGVYDMAQSAARVASGLGQAVIGYNIVTGDRSALARMPPWQFNAGGVDPLYNMQYQQQGQYPGMPYNYGTFPNYTRYPPYYAGQQFAPPFMSGGYQQPYPVVPYGTYPPPFPMQNYDMFGGAPYGYGYNPYYGPQAVMSDPMFGTGHDGLMGAGRAAFGAVKFAASALPVAGNILNGVDFVNDLRNTMRAFHGDPTSGGVMKNVAGLLAHGVGMIFPAVGAGYDVATGTMRATAAMANPYNWQSRLPAFAPNYGSYPPMYRPY